MRDEVVDVGLDESSEMILTPPITCASAAP